MTHYDKLIDSISDKLYTWYVTGQMDSNYDDQMAKRDAHEILNIVEEFQTTRTKVMQWRASD
jgi:hypothetical protein